jgi:hypothetical protein
VGFGAPATGAAGAAAVTGAAVEAAGAPPVTPDVSIVTGPGCAAAAGELTCRAASSASLK